MSSTSITRSPLDFHPKVTAAGLAGGLALVVAGVFEILGVPAPAWVAPIVTVLASVAAAYLKAS
jgi:hypothetical protein